MPQPRRFLVWAGRAHSRVALVSQGSDKRIDALSRLCQRIVSLVRPVSDKPVPVPLIAQPRNEIRH